MSRRRISLYEMELCCAAGSIFLYAWPYVWNCKGAVSFMVGGLCYR